LPTLDLTTPNAQSAKAAHIHDAAQFVTALLAAAAAVAAALPLPSPLVMPLLLV
jgi:hypothetical protein